MFKYLYEIFVGLASHFTDFFTTLFSNDPNGSAAVDSCQPVVGKHLLSLLREFEGYEKFYLGISLMLQRSSESIKEDDLSIYFKA